jgi:hypothetical protein
LAEVDTVNFDWRSDDVRSEGFDAVGCEKDVERSDAPAGSAFVVLFGVGGEKVSGRGGAGASAKDRYEMSGPPRRVTGTWMREPLMWPTSVAICSEMGHSLSRLSFAHVTSWNWRSSADRASA